MDQRRPLAPPCFPDSWEVESANLLADTPTSQVWEVARRDGTLAVVKDLKPAGIKDELTGILFLEWRDGLGAVRVLSRDGSRYLMEHAGEQSLSNYLQMHGDEAATAIAANTIRHLHGQAHLPGPPDQQPLRRRFKSLFNKAEADRRASRQSLFTEAASLAEQLLVNQHVIRPLHGDIHHENLLLGSRGWLAIDPKGVLGDPAYDTANLFSNPAGRPDLYEDPARAASLARQLASALDQDEGHLLQYGYAHACLSAAWYLEDRNLGEAQNSLSAAHAVRQALA